MKKINFMLIATATMMFLATVAYGGKISVEYGKDLFNDTKLSGSANELSCNSCHAGGKDLENAAGNSKLSKAINGCLTGHMEGNKMDGRKAEMRSLKKYVQSLVE